MAKNDTGKTNGAKSTDHRGDNAKDEARDDQGRFAKEQASSSKIKLPQVKLPKVQLPKVSLPKVKRPDIKLPELTARNAAIGALGAGAVVAAVAAGAALLRDRKSGEPDTSEAYVVDDSADGVGEADDARAPEAFRPDRDAPIPDDKRDAFAPATKPVPSRVEAMGNGND